MPSCHFLINSRKWLWDLFPLLANRLNGIFPQMGSGKSARFAFILDSILFEWRTDQTVPFEEEDAFIRNVIH